MAARGERAFRFLGSASIDAAILNVNVAGERVYTVEHEFVYAAAYGPGGWPSSMATVRRFRSRFSGTAGADACGAIQDSGA
jgi:hypothetical protein